MSRETAIQPTKSHDVSVNACQCEPTDAQRRESNGWSYRPPIDVVEYANEFTIELDAPGIDASEIELSYEHGVLSMHAPVRQRVPQNARFVRQEYGVGDFDRRIPLGRIAEFVDDQALSATYTSGVLTVRLPKLAQAHARKIEVKSAN